MAAEPERVGDYVLFSQFASGGMASIHLGRLVRPGFQRVVVVKRMHAEQASERGAAERLLREAHLSSRIQSPYVVPTIDVIHGERELCLVMDLVRGVTLARLLDLAMEERRPLPIPIVTAVFGDVLRGLHAAHEAVDESGRPLHVIHRDVTPRNILVGTDGITRVLDFGIAKALGQRTLTTTGDVRGTLAYMAPEILRGERSITRHADLYSLGVVLWEALAGERFVGPEAVVPNEARLRTPPSRTHGAVSPAIDAVVLRALRSDPSARFATAEEMAIALEEAAGAPATRDEVTRTLERLAFEDLERMAERVRECEAAVVRDVTGPTLDAATLPATRVVHTSRRGLTALVALIAVVGGVGLSMSLRRVPPDVSQTAPSIATSTSNISVRSAAPAARSTDMSTGPVGTLVTPTPTPTLTPTPSAVASVTAVVPSPRVRASAKPAVSVATPAPVDAGRKDPAADRM